MKAMILAAGLGTRLKNLTSDRPKALVEFRGKTLLENAITYLKKFGITEIVINVHHYADQVIDFINSNNRFDVNIYISDERGQLLDTGGGIINARSFLEGDEPFLVYNVDVICDLNLNDLLKFHNDHSSLATLCVRKRQSSRYLIFDDSNTLVAWMNAKTGERIDARECTGNQNQFAFSGIHLLSPEIFNLIDNTGKFSIIDVYLKLAANNKITSYDHSNSVWFDMGKIEDLELADKVIPRDLV